MTKEQIDTIVEMYKAERQYSAIAKATNLSMYQVKRWVRLNRDVYDLTRRRSLADKTGANSLSSELETTWNTKASRRYLTMKWGSENRECKP